MNAAAILEAISELNALVVGDICLDRWCTYNPKTAEPSRETGIDRIGVVSTSVSAGAAGTVANNLIALGLARVTMLGAIGDDGHGYELLRQLGAQDVSLELSVRSPKIDTFTYTKLINSETGLEDLPRVDFIRTRPIPLDVEEQLLYNLESYIEAFDVVLVSDQAETDLGGVVTPAIRQSLGDLALSYAKKVIWVDSRMRSEHFRNVILKPNRSEASAACEREFGVVDMGRLRAHTKAPFLVVTNGEEGVTIVEAGGETRVRTRPEPNPIDICGAGDSFSAAAATVYAVTSDPVAAARYGNIAASITIMKKGTGTASPDEVRDAERKWPE